MGVKGQEWRAQSNGGLVMEQAASRNTIHFWIGQLRALNPGLPGYSIPGYFWNEVREDWLSLAEHYFLFQPKWVENKLVATVFRHQAGEHAEVICFYVPAESSEGMDAVAWNVKVGGQEYTPASFKGVQMVLRDWLSG
jgi:hypothetical protein